jgi:hypothetical protein
VTDVEFVDELFAHLSLLRARSETRHWFTSPDAVIGSDALVSTIA